MQPIGFTSNLPRRFDVKTILDIGKKIDNKGHASRILRNYNLINTFSNLMDTNIGVHYAKGQFKDKRNIRHPDYFIRIDYLEQFIAEKVKNPISQDIRDRIAATSRAINVGDQSLHQVIDQNAINTTIATHLEPESGLAALNRVHQSRAIGETARDNILISPETTAQALGAPVLQITPNSEKVSLALRANMNQDHFNDLEENDTLPGFYIISFQPKLSIPPDNKPSPSGCMTLVCSKQDAPFGGAKIGYFGSEGLNRLQEVCNYFDHSLFDIKVETAFIVITTKSSLKIWL